MQPADESLPPLSPEFWVIGVFVTVWFALMNPAKRARAIRLVDLAFGLSAENVVALRPREQGGIWRNFNTARAWWGRARGTICDRAEKLAKVE